MTMAPTFLSDVLCNMWLRIHLEAPWLKSRAIPSGPNICAEFS